MPRTTPDQDAIAYALRTSGVSMREIAEQLHVTPQQATHAAQRHARVNSLPDPVRRRSVREAARYASGASLPFDAEAFAAANALAVPSEMGGAFFTGRTFGIEIEFQRPSGRSLSPETIAQALRDAGLDAHEESYNHHTRPHWKLIHDASSDRELVSPPLSGREGLREVRTAMRVLRELGCRVTRREGMHVHVFAGDLDPTRVAEVFAFYALRQTTFSQLISHSRRTAYYSQPVDANDARRTRELCARGSVRSACSRYVTVNLESYARYETVEFRQHQGSLNGRKACDWIELLLAVVTTIENGTEVACPMTLDGMLDYFVAARTMKRATADRLIRKATGYGWQPPSTPSPAPTVTPNSPTAPAVDASDALIVHENCNCVACQRAMTARAGLVAIQILDSFGNLGRVVGPTEMLTPNEARQTRAARALVTAS